MTTPLYQVQIRRDAHTYTPVSVPQYEIPILQNIFGIENVHNAEGKLIEEKGLGNPVGEYQPTEDEYARLCSKYGGERIEKVFGVQATGALQKAIKEAGKPSKKGVKAPKDDQEDDQDNGG